MDSEAACAENSSSCPPVADFIPPVAESCSESSDSRPEFRWTTSTRKAAALVAEDQITNAAIAENCRISPRTLGAWKQHPEFRAEVERHKSLISQDVLAFTIARRIERVRALDSIHTKLTGIVGIDPAPDPAYLREIREYQRQAAIEVGQWQEQPVGAALKPGEARLTITYDAIQQIQANEPERWHKIQQLADAIQAGRYDARVLPALGPVVDAVVEQPVKRGRGRPRKVQP